MSQLASGAECKDGFPFRTRRFLNCTVRKSAVNLDTAVVWSGAPISLLKLGRVQRKTIRMINDPSLTSTLQPLTHHRMVA